MIRVTIEIVPFGDERAKSVVSTAEIANIETRPDDCADYACRLARHGKVVAWAYVEDFYRGYGAEALVSNALDFLIEEEQQ